jgi:hypothetical protein
MSDGSFKRLKDGLIKRSGRRVVGLFIDGINLDRATRKLNRKVDLQALARGVCSGLDPVVARYYTVIPHEDDSRQRAFLEAVAKAGFSVIVKRLPPKGIERQVTTDLEMAADIVAFSMGLSSFSKDNEFLPADLEAKARELIANKIAAVGGGEASIVEGGADAQAHASSSERAPATRLVGAPLLHIDKDSGDTKRSVVILCPSRELSYPIGLAKHLGADTTTADFSKGTGRDMLRSAAKWIDLSDSESIWKIDE